MKKALFSLLIGIFAGLMLTACGGGGSSSSNTAPVADAGPDQNVPEFTLVTLDGSGSSDADGDTLTYAWSFVSKPVSSSAALSDAAVVNPSFTAAPFGTYVVQLIVNDGTVNSAADTVTIIAVK